MHKIKLTRTSLYILFMLLLSLVPILSALFLSHDMAYFGSNHNLAIRQVTSQKSNEQINAALMRYLDQHKLVLAKQVYVDNNQKIVPKTYVMGAGAYPITGIQASAITTDEQLLNESIIGDYALFGPGNVGAFANYLHELGLMAQFSNPNAPRQVVVDAINILSVYHLDYLLGFMLIVLILMNGFIIFKSTRAVALERLFQGKSPIRTFFNQVWVNVRGYFLAYVVCGSGLVIFSYIWMPDLMQLGLISTTALMLMCSLPLVFATGIAVFIFQRFNLNELLKGKGRYQGIPLLAALMLMLIFGLSVQVLQLNHAGKQEIQRLQASQTHWDKLADYGMLRFRMPMMDNDKNKALASELMHEFSESELLLSLVPGQRQRPPYEQDVVVSSGYFDIQKIHKKTGELFKAADFKAPYTLLTTEADVRKGHPYDLARFLMVDRQKMDVIKIKQQDFYIYEGMTPASQMQGYQRPKQVMVINLHALMNTPDNQLLYQGISKGNVIPWATQQALMVDTKGQASLQGKLQNVMPALQSIYGTKRIRQEIATEMLATQRILQLNFALALFVMVLAGFFITQIIFLAYQKELFIRRLCGQSFLKRYRLIYGMLIVSLMPGIAYAYQHPAIFWLTLGIVGILITIYTYQIVRSEHRNYQVLKGEL